MTGNRSNSIGNRTSSQCAGIAPLGIHELQAIRTNRNWLQNSISSNVLER